MKLRTEIQISPSNHKIDHRQKIYFTGSCFSEHISTKFKYHGFNVLSNSHGIIYNPISIEKSINDLLEVKQYSPSSLIKNGQDYCSLYHHGMFNGANADVVSQSVNTNIVAHSDFIKDSAFIFISLGTSWVYEWKETNEIVANCHKIPSNRFNKRILAIDEVITSIHKTIENIRAFNPAATIVFTLSPVKHLKDGFVENQLSKSILHLAIQNCLQENVNYFPAYEIINDDLRDYRFWAADMTHPNELAIDYIWEKFGETYFTKETSERMLELKKLNQFLAHRPLTNDIDELKKFEADQNAKKEELKLKYPYLIL